MAMHNAVEGCVSEAFAAVIAAHQAEHASEASWRAIFARIAADELRHGQLAWDLHALFMTGLDGRDQARVRRAQAEALAALTTTARANASASVAELGWPSPARAEAMARAFAAEVDGQLHGEFALGLAA